MSDKLYNFLNKLQRWLPSAGLFYLALCGIWGLPFGDEVNQTIIAVATLLGATLEISNVVYLKKVSDSIENKSEE